VAGSQCTAVGHMALAVSTADSNTAIGSQALAGLTAGTQNTVVGRAAGLILATGSRNTFIGYDAGSVSIASDSDNLYLGHPGLAGESGVTRIGFIGAQTRNFQTGIRGVVTGVADAVPVLIDSSGQLGTVSSSIRFKTGERDMTPDDTNFLYKLRPRKYRWIDLTRDQREQPGLIAEEVYEVDPFYISRSSDGEIETVKYHEFIIPMLYEIQRLRAAMVQHGLA